MTAKTCELCDRELDLVTNAYYQSYRGWRKNGKGAAKKGEFEDRYLCAHHIDRTPEIIGQLGFDGSEVTS